MQRTDLWAGWEDDYLMSGDQHLLNRTPEACKKRRQLLQRRGFKPSGEVIPFNPIEVEQAFNSWRAPAPAQLMGVVDVRF